MGKEYKQIIKIKCKWIIKCFILANNLKILVKPYATFLLGENL